MKVAIPVYGDRISPRFDYSTKVLLITIGDGQEIAREEIPTENINPLQRIRNLAQRGVDTVLCGAIDDFSMRMLAANGIRVIPWIGGEIEEIIKLYTQGQFNPERFALPGVIPGGGLGRRGRGQGRGRRRRGLR